MNLMSLKTNSKYLSVHFFRLCRALSLRRIHNTRNLTALKSASVITMRFCIRVFLDKMYRSREERNDAGSCRL